MSEAKDTLLRLIALLRLIPRAPGRIATTTVLEKLKDDGFSISLRTVQRDLDRLSIPSALQRDESSPPFRWCLSENAPIDLSAMDTPTALALYLAESPLKTLLPQSVLDQLGPQFRMARDYLDNLENNGLAHWARRVRAHPNGKSLQPAQIASQVWEQTSTALLEQKQLQINYLSRSKTELKRLLIHPAGLVSRHAISYLIGSVDGYDDLRQFALHRIHQAECLEAAARAHDDFQIDNYIRQDLNTTAPIEQVELVANVSPQVAWLLNETPLSQQQSPTPISDSPWQRLHAQVLLDQETLWWNFGLNENIRIHAPFVWVDEISQRVARMNTFYATPMHSQVPPSAPYPAATHSPL
ncbi:WYL domain-containing protein [Pseudomonas neustonica]|uniref:WYL domain-containing protein n=1 Tax=Pseudomonas neustonica TaxID=2487346 RepID=A0ABX9XKG7_9PSED|nr:MULTISPECIES: WYL domain-containing protein [Pseudomonas]ROZ84215.1 WYL domain-containing protein [Pseudomonas sp. SSM44]ROZ84462.1 WYL domain-containing protein [Pseudomonas neustonica]|tara:strand:+ start:91 stop:1155 length:1065 start_codon:yes stop_codon:yes gene_type:complete